MSPVLGHISSVLNISVRKAISRPERCKVLSQRWQKKKKYDTWPQFSLVRTIKWETKIVFFLLSLLPPGPHLPVSLLSASNCNLSLDPEPGVQIRDCWLRFSGETWARPCWWHSLEGAGLLQAKREITCQTRACLFFITNFLISLCFNSVSFPPYTPHVPTFNSFYRVS